MSTVVKEQKKTNSLLARYERLYVSPHSLLMNAKKGLKAQAVFDFMSLSGFSTPVLEKILNKTVKTFTNYKGQNALLDATVSEKLLKLFALYDQGLAVFGTLDELNKWIGEPAFGLGNQVPVEIMDTITGIDLVVEELKRIEYGDLA